MQFHAFVDALLLGRESHFICGHRIPIHILYFQILTTLSTFSSSRLSIAFADEKKLRNNVSYFPLVHFSNLRRKSSFTKKDLVFHMNYYFGIYFRESIALFIHTRVLAVKHP